MTEARTTLLAAILCALAASGPAAPIDDFRSDIRENPGRAAGLFHRYEFADIADTPPPDGFSPFYIAHYGRHGSRYQIDKKSFQVLDTLDKAAEAGMLTEAGESVRRRLRPLAEAHDGMFGALSLLGAEEHKMLARRMHARFPEVFSGPFAVRCQSSTIPRCLASMANFTTTLKGAEPQLDFSFETSDRTMRLILHPYLPSDARRKWTADFDRRIVVDNVNPSGIVSRILGDSPAAAEMAPDPHRFAFDLFMAANSFESLTLELAGGGIDDAFTPDEFAGLALARSCIHYAHMANAAEYGHCAAWSAHDLAVDIAARAQDAIDNGGVCADLRFGHDSGLRPLAGFIGIAGAGACAPAAESWAHCPTWKGMPMASNLQIVLYRNAGGEIIAKVLYNEAETAVYGLAAVAAGPYYAWDALKARLTHSPGGPDGRGTLIADLSGCGAEAVEAARPLLEKYGAIESRAAPPVQAEAIAPGGDAAALVADASRRDATAVVRPAGEGDIGGLLEPALLAARRGGAAILAVMP